MEDARGALDALADEPGWAAELRTKIDVVLQKLSSTREPERLQAVGLAAAPASIAQRIEHLRVEVMQLSLATRGTWGLLTWLAGIGLLVESSPGFGASTDYTGCVLWGLGVQMAGNQLQQVASSSVAGQLLGIPIPK